MKINKYIYLIIAIVLVNLGLMSCDNDIKDIPLVKENLELRSNTQDIKLDLDNPREVVLTFDWTEGRETSDNNMVSYTTKLDVVGNNFGTSTAIINYEEDDVKSRSFTTEQIYNWMVDRWNTPLTRPLQLEFRVVVEWEGGSKFEAPEVRTATVNVEAVKEEVDIPDMIALTGSSLNDDIIEIKQTLESESKYATLIELQEGELLIPVISDGDMKYLSPEDGTLKDGEAVDIVLQERRVPIQIKKAGEYRVIINLEDSKATIHSPDNPLEPYIATWHKNNETQDRVDTEVTELYLFGGGTSWGWWTGNMTQSLADPQILIYQGNPLSSGDGVKFVVYGESDFRNVAYTFTNPLKSDGGRQNLTLELNKVGELHGGYDGETRNSYYRLPAGANFIVLDLRNKTIIARKQ